MHTNVLNRKIDILSISIRCYSSQRISWRRTFETLGYVATVGVGQSDQQHCTLSERNLELAWQDISHTASWHATADSPGQYMIVGILQLNTHLDVYDLQQSWIW